jgi:uncharacterized repeat protein (TIGR01451 family)
MSVTVTDTLPISMDLDGNLITSWSEVIAYERNDPEGWFSLTFREARPTQRWDIWMGVVNPNPDPVPGGQFFTNFAEVMQVDGEPTYLDNMTDYTLASGLDLYVQKSLVSGDIVPGEEATFSLLYGNQQDGQFWRWGLQGTAWLTDVLPANTELVAATQRFCYDSSWCQAWPIVQDDMLKWGIWPLDPGAWNELYVTVRLTDTLSGSTTITNLASITSDQPDVDLEPVYGNNTSVYTFTTMLPTYAVDKVYESSAIAGTPVTYTLTVNNSGSLTGSGIMVSDQLPEDLTYLSGGSYNADTGEVMWTLPSLAVGSSVEAAFVGQLTCEVDVEVVNAFYRVADSNESVISAWGAPVALTVVPPTISASFEASAVSIEEGDTVYFTSTAETDGAALIYAWDFGGDGSADGPVVSHTFNTYGKYGVYLIVMDDCGYGADYYMMIEVNKPVEGPKKVYLPLIRK